MTELLEKLIERQRKEIEQANEVYKLHRELISTIQNQLLIHPQTNSCACPTAEELNAAFRAILVDFDSSKIEYKSNKNFPIFDSFLEFVYTSKGINNDNTKYRDKMDLLCEKLSTILGLCRSNIFASPKELVQVFHLSEITNTTNCYNHQILIKLLEWCLIRDELRLMRNNNNYNGELYCEYFRLLIADENTCENIRIFLSLIMSICWSENNHRVESTYYLTQRHCPSLIVKLFVESLERSQFLVNPENRMEIQLSILKMMNIMDKMNLPESTQNQLKSIINKIYDSISKEYMKNGGFDYAKFGYYEYCSIQDYQLQLICNCLTLFDGSLFTEKSECAPKFPATLDPNYRDPILKLSPDKLFVRQADYSVYSSSIRSVNSVNSGIFYYEVFVIKNGWFHIGWANAKARIIDPRCIGDDENSIGFNHCRLWHCKRRYATENESFCNGSVIGCLIDFAKRQFTFSLDGERIRLKKKYFFSSTPEFHFSTEFPYYAAIGIANCARCYVNFGQVPFKYSPRKVEYWDFCLNEQFGKQSQVDRGISVSHIQADKSQIIIGSTSSIGGNFNIRSIQASTSGTSSDNFPPNESTSASQNRICSMCKKQAETNLIRFVCCDNLTFCRDCVDLIKDCPVHRVK